MWLDEAWRRVVDTWFPQGLERADAATHHRMFEIWFDGGMRTPCMHLAPIAAAAQAGALDHWCETAHGRLALILLLDQVPRGVFAGRAEAYGGDADALRFAEEGLRNGHYDFLAHPWERTFFFLPLAHAEGPDHRQRLIRVTAMAEAVAASAPDHLRPLYRFSADQARGHRAVIERFGRYPHRNGILGRVSTPEEEAYLRTGDLVHRRRPPLLARLGWSSAPDPTTA